MSWGNSTRSKGNVTKYPAGAESEPTSIREPIGWNILPKVALDSSGNAIGTVINGRLKLYVDENPPVAAKAEDR